MPVLAIDQGTSATKALVVDDDGRTVLGSATAPVAVVAGADGSVEADPEELWASVVAAGQAALDAAGSPRLAAVGLANQGETVLAWDRATGASRSRAIVWQDGRAVTVCDALRPHADRLAALTGLQLDPYFVAPKVAWLRPRVASDATITTTDTWLLHRLCGAFVTDAATASRTLLLDLDRAAWSDEAAALFGIDAASLPTVVDNAGVIGDTVAFGAPVPVAGACVDQQAALFAQACFAPGEAKCTYGTGAFLLATTAAATRSANGLVGCVAWRLDGTPTWCLDGQVFTVGAALGWLEQLGVIAGPEDLDRLGGAVDGTGGVTFVPALAGHGAPFWRPEARAALTGLTLAAGRPHVVRAVVDGIAANVAWLARAVGADLGAPIARLRVDGGLTRSRVLLQAQADAAQVPVEVSPSPDATALGVAAFARLGVGAARSPTEAVGGWRPSATFEPRIGPDEADARLASWRRVAEATAGL
jgi:glycerol kinase